MGTLVISEDYFTTKRSRTFRKLAIAMAIGAIAYATVPPIRLIMNSGVSYVRHQACKWNHRDDAWWEVWEWGECYTPGTIKQIANALKSQESGGDHTAVNPDTGALEFYQIMPGNLPSWSREAVGREVSQVEFLSDPDLQHQVAYFQIEKQCGPESKAAKDQREFIERCASQWYSGRPDLCDSERPQPSGNNVYPSISEYCNAIADKAEYIGLEAEPFNFPSFADIKQSIPIIGSMANAALIKGLDKEFVTTKYTVATPYLYDQSPPGAWDFTFIDPATGNQSVNVPSPCTGKIDEVGYNARAGNYVWVGCNRGEKWFMAHYASTAVETGDWVTKGQSIGRQGTTGNSSGIHLHTVIVPPNGDRQNRDATKPFLDQYFADFGL